MPLTCAASPNKVKIGALAVISVSGRATAAGGAAAQNASVSVRADWGESATAQVNPGTGDWGATLRNMPNQVGTWAIHCECPGVGYRATAAKRE